jgi:O-antigen ligase
MALLKPEIQNKAYHYLFLALSFCIPVHDKLVPPIIALIGINWLLEFNFRVKVMRLKNIGGHKILLLPGVLYVLYVIGTFYSSQLKGQSGALFDLEVKLSLLLFPLFFSTIDFSKFRDDFYKKVLKAFVYGCLVSSIIIINKAMMDYFKEQDASVFYYTNLSWMHHPSYVAMYFTFAVVILLTWILQSGNKIIFKRNLAILLIFHFQIFIVLLSSKAGIIGFLITCALFIVWILMKKNNLKISLTVSVLVMAAFILILFIFPDSFNRFNTAKKSIEDNQIPDNQKTEGSVARLMVWESSLEVIKENFLFGVGTGDVKTELIKKYEEKGILQALKENLNAHNQYLQTFIALGFVGFILLMSCLIFTATHAFNQGNILILLFIVLFAFHILVESMLERQGGVVFFTFFYSFFLSKLQGKKFSGFELPEV